MYFDSDRVYLADTMVSWSKPVEGPWSRSVTDHLGRSIETATYQNGSTTFFLAKSSSHYDQPGKPMRLTSSRVHEVDGSGGLSGNYLESVYSYDDAERQVRTMAAGQGINKTEFDDWGRTLRSVQAASEGNATSAVDFTDDVVLIETVYGYDDVDNVITLESFSRIHDASATGLLSAAAANQRQAHYTATWYDHSHRPTHSADYGDTAP